MNSFICAICGDRKPMWDLSYQTLALADTRSAADAIETLPSGELICADCEPDAEESIPWKGIPEGLTEYEKMIFSGVTIDPCIMQTYRLNY